MIGMRSEKVVSLFVHIFIACWLAGNVVVNAQLGEFEQQNQIFVILAKRVTTGVAYLRCSVH